MIFNITGGGGGSAALNFNVVTYATEEEMLAATPSENTIGIVTNTPMSSWIFSWEEPTNVDAGTVWIFIGTSSTVAFNALKKNGIQVYPIFAKQYIGGAWVEKTAMSYQGNEWVGWVTYLYNYGNQTYEWQARGWKWNHDTHIEQVPTVKQNVDGSITFTTTITGSTFVGGGGLELKEDFDLTNIQTLELVYKLIPTYDYDGNEFPVSFIVVPRNATLWGSSNVANAVLSKDETSVLLPVKNISGTYDIAVMAHVNGYRHSGSVSCTIKEIKAY